MEEKTDGSSSVGHPSHSTMAPTGFQNATMSLIPRADGRDSTAWICQASFCAICLAPWSFRESLRFVGG